MKGQLSAEMVLLVVVILAIVAIVALSLTETAKEGAENIEKGSEKIVNKSMEYVENYSS